MQKKEKKQKSFDKIMLTATIPANLIAAVTVFTYGLITMQLSLSFLWPAIKLMVPLVAVAQFLIAPFIDGLFTKPISRKLKQFENGELDERSRTELAEMLMQYPIKNFFKVMAFFVSCGVILCVMYKIVLDLPSTINIMAFVGYAFGAYFAAVLGFDCAYRYSSPIAIKVINKGVNINYVRNKKALGTLNIRLLSLFVLIPACLSVIVCFIVFLLDFLPYNPDYYLAIKDSSMKRIFSMAIINIIIQIVCLLIFYGKIWKKNEQMAKVMEEMNNGNINTSSLLDTDLGDEISMNFFLTNQILLYFRQILQKSEEIGEKIKNHAKELVKVSSETQATVVEQSTGVREIVSTMEDANRLAHSIELSINDVTESAEKTAQDVENGSGMISGNLEEIQHISQTNEETINGIIELNDRIESIWEVVNIINNIADQTKIIAFNAELEATSVAKTDFKNVSMEIRRLANTTMDSTKEIKQKINEIQEAANALINSSHQTTEKIEKGENLILSLEERFSSIKESTQVNADSANEIKMLVNQQTAAFEQIVNTLHQISSGIENFSISTKSILETSHLLENNAENLSKVTAENTYVNAEKQKEVTDNLNFFKDVKEELKKSAEESRDSIKDVADEMKEELKDAVESHIEQTVERIAEKAMEHSGNFDDFLKKDSFFSNPPDIPKTVPEDKEPVSEAGKVQKPKGLLAMAAALTDKNNAKED